MSQRREPGTVFEWTRHLLLEDKRLRDLLASRLCPSTGKRGANLRQTGSKRIVLLRTWYDRFPLCSLLNHLKSLAYLETRLLLVDLFALVFVSSRARIVVQLHEVSVIAWDANNYELPNHLRVGRCLFHATRVVSRRVSTNAWLRPFLFLSVIVN